MGNGAADSHWVHDDMEVSAVAFQEQGSSDVTVLVAANLYMIFGTDGDVIRERVADKIGPKLASRLQIAISADHNHHGPDTAFDVNHEWYDLMIEQAVRRRRRGGRRDAPGPPRRRRDRALLRAATTDGTRRSSIRRSVCCGQRRRTAGRSPPSCSGPTTLRRRCSGSHRSPPPRTPNFTADYPGWATRIIEDELGGEALFFNGAVGGLVTPLGSNVWEVGDDAPLGLGLVPPVGAQPPLGADDFEQRNFRRTYLIGRELARAALGALGSAAPVKKPKVDYEVETDLHADVAHRLPALARPG